MVVGESLLLPFILLLTDAIKCTVHNKPHSHSVTRFPRPVSSRVRVSGFPRVLLHQFLLSLPVIQLRGKSV